ncbi:MAG: NADPH:quinone oxidoreductase family protein [Alphaproteobacteria bacterium]|nr:MAG: NADPH:quinone oxidoreductase family protein [Alphaproteobacteria bacterium]
MFAIECDSHGWPRKLELSEVRKPLPQPGQLLVKVRAAGVNFADMLVMEGAYQEKLEPPFIPGAELVGTVVEVGADVTGFTVGDQIISQVPSGAFAEYAIVEASRAVKTPVAMDIRDAAGFYIAYGTAYCGLMRRARFQTLETVLVTGAGGGVGRATVDITAALGGTPLAIAGGKERRDDLLRIGAEAVFDREPDELRQKVMDATCGKGVDIALDVVGGETTRQLVRCLAFEGRLLLVGFAAGNAASLPANHLLVKNVDVSGFYWGPYQSRFLEETRRSFDHLFQLYADGKLHPQPALSFPIDRINDAYTALLERKHSGKIILEVSP